MKLKEYIEKLQKIYEAEGDISLYTSIDDEGNGYNRACYTPEVRLLSKEEDQSRPEFLIPLCNDDENLSEWANSWLLEEEDIVNGEPNPSNFKRVVLL